MEMIGLVIIAFIYLIPTFVGFSRGHLASGAIFVANIVFGWTLLGWLIVLIWAFNSNTKANRELYYQRTL
ncbi:hypothetical protein [Providencia phage PSTCR6]|nr:hypothetical protein [Providencia phage PSTCR6]